MPKSLKGIFAPITTPFDERGSVLYERLAENVRKYSETGLRGFLILGSNGENKSLTTAEKERVLKTVLEHKNPEQTAMAGSIFESTRETLEFALLAQEAGADYITLLPPSYFKSAMKDNVLLKYFSDVADGLKIPVLLYKAPQFSGGVDLSLNLIRECAAHPNIRGIKDSSSSGIEKILYGAPENFWVLSGSANTFLAAMLGGAAGGILSMADYLPEIAVRLYQYIIDKDLNNAVKLNQAIVKSNIGISGAYGVAGVKCAMDMSGYYGGFPRMPLPPVPPEARPTIKGIIETVSKPGKVL